MASEASFAALAGTSPLDASSGQQRRHRLNRGGDRQLNRALHVIALARIHHHAETAAYYQRLLAAGKTAREARRCVKTRPRPLLLPPPPRTPNTRLDNIEASKTVAVGCDPLPLAAHGKQGVCRGCHPLREVPSLRGRRSIPVGIIERDYFIGQSGHGHWSQPQPVHASRIIGAFYPPDDPGDARTVQPVST
jgi:hypothetical protein